MTKYSLLYFILVFCVQQNIAQTLPAERATNWQLAGLKNSIPENENSINFQEAGGVPDGITSNDEILAAIQQENESIPHTIFFPTGTYFFSETVQLHAGNHLVGASADSTTLRFDLNGSGDLIHAAGNVGDVFTVLKNDAFKDELFILVDSAALFSAGDDLKIIDDDAALVTSSWAENSTGQIVEVADISGDTIFLASPLRRNFSVGLGTQIFKINLVENILLENFAIERMDSTAMQTGNIVFDYVGNSKIKCLKSLNCNFGHVDIRNSTNVEISGSWFQDGFDYGGGGKAYGVVLHFATGECLVTENIFKHLRHSMLLQAGANGNVLSYNYSRDPFWTDVILPPNSAGDMVLHGNYPYCNLFEGNVLQNIVIDNSHGINGPYNTFFRNRGELYGIFMNNNPASDGQNFIGNEITNFETGLGFYFLQGENHFEYGNNVLSDVVPDTTAAPGEASLYLSAVPIFYENNSDWPPVGLPNGLTENTVEAVLRYGDGLQTACSLTPLVSVSESMEYVTACSIFPNPVDDILYVKNCMTSDVALPGVQLFSPEGKLLLQKKLADSIDVGHIPEGIYFLKIKYSEQRTVFKKLIIQRR